MKYYQEVFESILFARGVPEIINGWVDLTETTKKFKMHFPGNFSLQWNANKPLTYANMSKENCISIIFDTEEDRIDWILKYE